MRIQHLRAALSAAAFASIAFGAPAALAVPKAAEHEDAPVTQGAAETPRPKPAAKAPPPAKPKVVGHARATAKGKPVQKTAKARVVRK